MDEFQRGFLIATILGAASLFGSSSPLFAVIGGISGLVCAVCYIFYNPADKENTDD